jgi:NADPH:quinone reductase-like Zn-dependent oxidoreductase
MLKRLTVTGSTLRIRTDSYQQGLAEGVVAQVWPMIAQGKFRPLVDRVFPLAEADAAHARMESGEHAGKIILQVSG